MHYALSIPELLAAIFKQIDDEDLWLWVDTLAALARTCRAFHPTALDTRWASVDAIKWLLRLIPGDARTHHSAAKLLYLPSTITRDLTVTEWDNFHGYTSRIKELDFQRFHPGDDDLLISILRLCPFRPAFPNLRFLATHVRLLPCISTLLGPTLESITFFIPGEKKFSDSELSDLKALGTICPKLKILDIHFYDPNWSEILSEMVCGCHHVNRFTCTTPLSNSAFRHVARLPNLEKLRIYTHHLWSLPLSETATAPYVDIRGSLSESPMTGDNDAFLPSIRSAPTILDISSRDVPPTEEIRKFFKWLSTLDAPSTLVHLELSAVDIPPYRNHPQPCTFEPLFRFRGLRHLIIDGICALPFNDDTLQAFADAYPLLELLSLNYKTGWREPRVTIHGLARLFKGCRNLLDLHMAIDATVVDPLPKELTGRSVQNTLIGSLYLVDSPVSHPIAVAGLLQEILPRLHHVHNRSSYLEMDFDYLGTHAVVWEEVSKQCEENISMQIIEISGALQISPMAQE